MHAPVLTDSIKNKAAKLDEVSDMVDEINVLKAQAKDKESYDKEGAAADRAEAARLEAAYDGESKFDAEKDKSTFRIFDDNNVGVKNLYIAQHKNQTYDYNVKMRQEFRNTTRARMSVWEALELLDNLVDESDPDTSVGQIEHLLQTAEAIRRDGKPEWMQVVGLIHDLGKLLCFFGADGQWDVVGDTFVVGCAFDGNEIVYPDTFKANPDYTNPKLNTKYGVYEPNCGLDNVLISWGHDEYMYHICKEQSSIPKEGLSMIRYHSFYPWHREGAYRHLMNDNDHEQLKAVKAFNPYDLYSKSDAPPKKADLKPYYCTLIDKFFPKEVQW
ncbi:hypothetical protein IAR50_006266 [Cryptococcus sp. DSM 104548]